MREPLVRIGEPRNFNRRFKYWSEQWPGMLGVLVTSFLWFSMAGMWARFSALISLPEVPPFWEPVLEEFLLGQILAVLVLLVCALGLYIVAALPVVLFLPTFFRNPMIESWNRALRQGYEKETLPCFVVDLILKPRLMDGFERTVEDADDVGLLSLRPDHLRFDGDSIAMVLPWADAADLKVKRTNWRGAWVVGKDFHFRFRSPIEGREGMVLRVREGWTILHTRERSRELQGLLEHYLQAAASEGTA